MSQAGKDYSLEFAFPVGETPVGILREVANILNFLHSSVAASPDALDAPEARHGFCEMLRASEVSIRTSILSLDRR